MKAPIEFTHRERYVLSYLRDPQLSSWSRRAFQEGSLIIISLGALALYLVQHDAGWGAVAYGLLLWRAGASLWRARSYTETYRDIFSKYDAKIEEAAKQFPNPDVTSAP